MRSMPTAPPTPPQHPDKGLSRIHEDRIDPRDPNRQNGHDQLPTLDEQANPNRQLPHHPDVEGTRPPTREELTATPAAPLPEKLPGANEPKTLDGSSTGPADRRDQRSDRR